MSLFKKPNRQFRKRVAHSDSEDEATDASTEVKKNSVNKNVNESSSECSDKFIKKHISLLSFKDEEEEGELFKIKKSNYSKRMTKQAERERKKKQKQEAKIAEVNTQIEKNKEEEKRRENASKVWSILNGEEAEDLVSDDDEEEGQHRFRKTLKSGEIPDAETIYAMKKQRQRARELGDYIPVDDKFEESENQSRLIREDDNDQSDDDEPERLNFSVDIEAIEKKKAMEAILNVNEEKDLEKEEAAELDRWEEEQIRKGVSVSQLQPITPGSLFFNCPVDVDERQNFIPPIIKVRESITTEMIEDRLKDSLNQMKERHRVNQNELDKCHNDLIFYNSNILELREKTPKLEAKFKIYQQLRGYVADLVECLDVKVKSIETLEQQMHDLLKQRAINMVLRRQQDIKDQTDDYVMSFSKNSRGLNFDSLQDQAQIEEKARRAAEREGRRMRRRKTRQQNLILNHNEGMSTDDEQTESDIIKFENKKQTIIKQAEEIFDDVVEAFSTIKGIINQFSKWRSAAPDTYYDAYAPLCLVKIFTPFVQLELLDWNPMVNSINIEQMKWFQELAAYGFLDDYDSEESDVNLIPNIIEKVLLKKVTALVPYVWDPLSSTETLQLVSLTKNLVEYPTITSKSKNFQAFLQAVVGRITKSLEQDIFIPLYSREILQNRMSGAVSFFNRQFWTATKLFKNILLWHGILADEPLKELALNSLLNRYLLMTLRNSMFLKDCIEKSQAIVAATSHCSWFSSLPGSVTIPQMQMFCTFLKDMAKQISCDVTFDEHQVKLLLKQIIQMLYNLGALDEVTILTKEFSSILAYK